jgi:hypothetical protein
MTPDDLASSLRSHVDAVAPPITLDELRAADPVVRHPGHRRRAALVAAVAAGVLVVAGGLAATRSGDGDRLERVETPATEPPSTEPAPSITVVEPGIYGEVLPVDDPVVSAVLGALPPGSEVLDAMHVWSPPRRIDHHAVVATDGDDRYDVTAYGAFTPQGLGSFGDLPRTRDATGTTWVAADGPETDVVVFLSDEGTGVRIALTGPSAADESPRDLSAIAALLAAEPPVADLDRPSARDLEEGQLYSQDLEACMDERGMPIELIEQSAGAFDIDGGDAEGTPAFQSALDACSTEGQERAEVRRWGPGGAPDEPPVEMIPFDGQDDADRVESCLAGLGFIVELTFQDSDGPDNGMSIDTPDDADWSAAAFDTVLDGCSSVSRGLGGPPG